MLTINDLFSNKNKIAQFYSEFKVEDRILLTGHSHQAWPDCAFNGMKRYWIDSSEFVDNKWEFAFKKADRVRSGFAKLTGTNSEEIVLGQNTHELLLRLLSSIDLVNRPKIITTDSEFHTARRQFDKLAEIRLIELIKLNAEPVESLSERISKIVDEKTSVVMVSKVFFNNANILENIEIIYKQCNLHGAYLILDVYHALNAIPFSVINEFIPNAFLIGGGYKYCQLGEGNCFLRIPPDCKLKPAITGWFSEFTALADKTKKYSVIYGEGHWAFAGSTYDPVSHYRACEVFDFFEEHNLIPEFLRQVSRIQIDFLASEFDSYDLPQHIIKRDTCLPLDKSGGFLVLKTEYANIITNKLHQRNILVDYRGNNLRLGPAPYLNKSQLSEGMATLAEIASEL